MTGVYGQSPPFHRGKTVFCILTRSFLPTQCALGDMRGSVCKPDRNLEADGTPEKFRVKRKLLPILWPLVDIGATLCGPVCRRQVTIFKTSMPIRDIGRNVA